MNQSISATSSSSPAGKLKKFYKKKKKKNCIAASYDATMKEMRMPQDQRRDRSRFRGKGPWGMNESPGKSRGGIIWRNSGWNRSGCDFE